MYFVSLELDVFCHSTNKLDSSCHFDQREKSPEHKVDVQGIFHHYASLHFLRNDSEMLIYTKV